MSIFESIFSAITGKKEPPSIVTPTSIPWLTFSTDISLGAFYKIYRDNQFVRSNVTNLMDTVWKYGFNLVDSEKNESSTEEKNKVLALFEDFKGRNKFKSFFKKAVREYFVGWNVYIFKVGALDDQWERTWEITSLQILDARFIVPITDKTGFVLWYIQNINSRVTFFLEDEISHLKYDSDIDDETVWLPLLRSLTIDLDLDQEAKESNLAFFKNNQTPNSIIVLKDWITLEEWKKIAKMLKEQFRWGKNHHRAAVMAWLEDIIKVQDKIDDGQFLDMRKFTRDNVCALFWVPKTVLWYTEGVNYTNAERQFSEYIEDTIRPTEELFSEFITQILEDIWFEDIFFVFIDNHLDRKAIKAKTTIELVNNWLLTINEWRAELWEEPVSVKEADELWIWTNKKIVWWKEKVEWSKE